MLLLVLVLLLLLSLLPLLLMQGASHIRDVFGRMGFDDR
jgi:hypothetical protein